MLLDEAKTTGQVVMGQGIAGTKVHQAFVDVEAFGEPTLEREVVALNPQHVYIVGVSFQDASKEIQFKIKLAQLGVTNHRATGRR